MLLDLSYQLQIVLIGKIKSNFNPATFLLFSSVINTNDKCLVLVTRTQKKIMNCDFDVCNKL